MIRHGHLPDHASMDAADRMPWTHDWRQEATMGHPNVGKDRKNKCKTAGQSKDNLEYPSVRQVQGYGVFHICRSA
jgi:hypothetical protein